eukprot:SAG31_NODE_11941_length_983_cov_1.360860_1_plen_169_part_10
MHARTEAPVRGYFLVFVQLFEKYGTSIERHTALIEKVSALIGDTAPSNAGARAPGPAADHEAAGGHRRATAPAPPAPELQTMISMGFDARTAALVLRAADGNVEHAVQALLENPNIADELEGSDDGGASSDGGLIDDDDEEVQLELTDSQGGDHTTAPRPPGPHPAAAR